MTEVIDQATLTVDIPLRSKSVRRAQLSALVSIFIGYATVGLIFAYVSRHLLFTDGISYFQIAEQYRDGHWANAINGYWGPLLSWLLVPFLASGFGPQVAFRVLNWLVGGLALAAAWRLSRHYDLPNAIRLVFLTIAAIMLVAWSVAVITPDLLLACLLLFLFERLLATDLINRPTNAVICGVLGGLAYLAKPFAFGFFLIAFPLASLGKFSSKAERLLHNGTRQPCSLGWEHSFALRHHGWCSSASNTTS